jgi:hypothetical protein
MTKNLVLTPEQRKQLEELKALEAAEIAAKKEERNALKELTDENVKEGFEILLEVSDFLSKAKKKVYGMFADIIELKKQVYDGSDEQYSHTFTTKDGNYRIIIGFHVVDSFDDSHTAGVDGVNKFLNKLGVDKDSKMLVKMAKKLLSRDAKGTLNARKVMQLLQMANEHGDKDFIDNVQIIIDAYKPIKTKMYMIARYRREKDNEWLTLPLGITEASLD